MKMIIRALFCYLFICGHTIALAQSTAAILPQGKQQFLDNNGNPLSSGKVYFYIPNTTTFKTTWQDAAETIANTNPVTLDAGGRAIIYGAGTYRQIVKNSANTTIFDAVTASAGTGGGTTGTGDGDLVGTVKPWAGLIAPNQYVFAYGQEISRTTYAAYFTATTLNQNFSCTSGSPILTGLSDTSQIPVGSVIETTCVAAGSTVLSKTSTTATVNNNASLTTATTGIFFLYGNGNGSTTFNVPDLRGYVVAGRCNMGGTDCTNLTTAGLGENPSATGAQGGASTRTLLTGNLPPYTPAGLLGGNLTVGNGGINIGDPGHTHTLTAAATNVINNGTGGGANLTGGGGALNVSTITVNAAATGIDVAAHLANGGTFAGTAQGGTSIPFSIIQPTTTLNYIVKITPDQNSTDASGVTSLGLMTGDIACGSGVTCTGNIISAVTNWTASGTGGITRTSQSTFQERGISVVDYGGTMNNISAAAINSTALLNACANPNVIIPAGIFYINPTVTIPATCKTITGQGVDSSFILAAADDPIGQPPLINQSHPLNLSNLTVGVEISAGGIAAGSHQLTWGSYADGTRFNNVHIYGPWALDLTGASNVGLTNIEINYFAYGIGAFSRATNINIINPQIGPAVQGVSRGGQAILFAAPDGLGIYGGQVGAPGNQAVYVFPIAGSESTLYPKNVVIDGMRINTTGLEAIMAQDARGLVISNNRINGGPTVDNGIGVYANDGTADPTLLMSDTTISNNSLTNIGGNCIEVNVAGAAKGITVSGNSVNNCGAYAPFVGGTNSTGIHVYAASTIVNIAGNTVRDDYYTTSTTSNTIGTGAKTFTVNSGLPYIAGDTLFIKNNDLTTINTMLGTVTSYSGTSLVMSIASVAGSGTFVDWRIGRMYAGILEETGASGTNVQANKAIDVGVAQDIRVNSTTSGGLNGRIFTQGTSPGSSAAGLIIHGAVNPYGWEQRVLDTGSYLLSIAVDGLAPTTRMQITNSGIWTLSGYTTGIAHFDSSGTISSSGIAPSDLSAIATNTVIGNSTSGSAVPTALSVGSCSTTASALIWTTNTGFGCNTTIVASSATTATNATNTTNTAITDDTTTNSFMLPTWVTTNTGNLPQKVSSTKFAFNPSTSSIRLGVRSSATSTATPTILDLGDTFSSSPGANLKICLLNASSCTAGIGVSTSQVDFVTPTASQFEWYVGSTATAGLSSTGAWTTIGGHVIGVNGGTNGSIALNGSTSGTATIKVAAVAGTTNFQLPVGNGTNGFQLTTDGAGVTSWTANPGFTAATQADQETATSITTGVTPGRQQFHPSASKFWAYYSGAGSLLASYNVASSSKVGTGQYRINLTTAMSSGNFAAVGSCSVGVSAVVINSTSQIDIFCFNLSGVATDGLASLVGFGDQ